MYCGTDYAILFQFNYIYTAQFTIELSRGALQTLLRSTRERQGPGKTPFWLLFKEVTLGRSTTQGATLLPGVIPEKYNQ